jgi:hypothetical protein
MVTDLEAEHVPGCNMAYYKWALEQIGMFDPIFRKAGDDVDVCWRLHDSGLKIGFSHGGFVWHYRRSTVKAYLKQQAGYGEAEALLIGKHPEHYNELGGGSGADASMHRLFRTALESVADLSRCVREWILSTALCGQPCAAINVLQFPRLPSGSKPPPAIVISLLGLFSSGCCRQLRRFAWHMYHRFSTSSSAQTAMLLVVATIGCTSIFIATHLPGVGAIERPFLLPGIAETACDNCSARFRPTQIVSHDYFLVGWFV